MKKNIGSGRAFSRYKLALLVGLVLSGFCFVLAPQISAGITTSHQVQVTATVNGPPPTIASTIISPIEGQVITALPIEVRGTCPQEDLVIKIFDNNIFVGSTVCQSNSSYSVSVDLFRGHNRLVAKEFDSTNQQGPDSTAVNVTYSPAGVPTLSPPPSTKPPTKGSSGSIPKQLTIALDSKYGGYTGTGIGQLFTLPLSVHGGTAPYTVHIDWGDGSSETVILKNASQPLVAAHNYSQGGVYQVNIKVTDVAGQQAFFSVVVIINGPYKPAITAVNSTDRSSWQDAYYYQWAAVLLLLPLGFWLGKSRFNHKHLDIGPKEFLACCAKGVLIITGVSALLKGMISFTEQNHRSPIASQIQTNLQHRHGFGSSRFGT